MSHCCSSLSLCSGGTIIMELNIHGRLLLTRSLIRRIVHYRRAAPWSYIGLAEYPLALRTSGYSASYYTKKTSGVCCFAVDTRTCVFEDPRNRVDCGYPRITSDDCISKGCCWDSSVKGVPFCFNPEEIKTVDFRHGVRDLTRPYIIFAITFSVGCRGHRIFWAKCPIAVDGQWLSYVCWLKATELYKLKCPGIIRKCEIWDIHPSRPTVFPKLVIFIGNFHSSWS